MFTECILAHHIHFMKMENCYSQLQEEKEKNEKKVMYSIICQCMHVYNIQFVF